MTDTGNSAKPPIRFAALAFVTAAVTFALIVFGGVVRITGSGMGCGDDWPLCNGQLIPPMDFETLIEYGHRLAAALVGFLVVGVGGYAFRHRRRPEFADGGAFQWAAISVTLLLVQVMLGAVTVWLELPSASVVLHLSVGSALLAALLLSGLSVTAGPAGGHAGQGAARRNARWAIGSAVLGFVVVVFGGLVANTGAALACQGFPLCNGRLLPGSNALIQIQWAHRMLAFALAGTVVAATVSTFRRGAPRAIGAAAIATLLLVGGQLIVAAALVLRQLPDTLRGLHLAVGSGVWAALIVWSALAIRATGRSLRIGLPDRKAASRPDPVKARSGYP